MITAIIIDDERQAREVLEKLINKHFSDRVLVLDKASGVREGAEKVQRLRPELVFLDIKMPDEDGFELFKNFDPLFFDIIFTTAYEEYAIQAIRHAALDYLLKPIKAEDLDNAIKRMERKRSMATNQKRIETLLQNLSTERDGMERLALPTNEGYQMVKFSNIMFCEGLDNYNRVHTFFGENYLISKTLKKMEELLPEESFVRIHRSYIVNLNYVNEFRRKEGQHVILTDGRELPVSARKKEQLLKAISAT